MSCELHVRGSRAAAAAISTLHRLKNVHQTRVPLERNLSSEQSAF